MYVTVQVYCEARHTIGIAPRLQYISIYLSIPYVLFEYNYRFLCDVSSSKNHKLMLSYSYAYLMLK